MAPTAGALDHELATTLACGLPCTLLFSYNITYGITVVEL